LLRCETGNSHHETLSRQIAARSASLLFLLFPLILSQEQASAEKYQLFYFTTGFAVDKLRVMQ
jgi:hypothetical protein